MNTPPYPGPLAADDLTRSHDLIGPIVRVQVQAEPLKQGERGGRWYEPGPITSVSGLRLEPDGVCGVGDTVLLDVHHRDHPRSRFRGDNGISIGFTEHYAVMRAAFGPHMAAGIAGENVLIASTRVWTEAELAGGLLVATADGPVQLDRVLVAAPCVEFSRFCLGLDPAARPDRRVTAALQALNGGVRGFYATWVPASDAALPGPVIRPGDRVFRRHGEGGW